MPARRIWQRMCALRAASSSSDEDIEEMMITFKDVSSPLIIVELK